MNTKRLLNILILTLPFLKVYSQSTVDMSHLIVNADFSQGTDGWNAQMSNNVGFSQVWNVDVNILPRVVEAYSGFSELEMYSFELTQDVSLEAGRYRLSTNSFYRWGSSFSSDLNNADGIGARSLAYLIAGNDSVKIKRLGDVTGSDLRPTNYAHSMAEASAAFDAGLYVNTLYFELNTDTVINIGFRGINDRTQCWFISGPIKLEKVTKDIETLEAKQRLETYKKLYTDLKDKYTEISQQQYSLGVFNTVQADEMFTKSETISEIEDAIRILSNSLADYMLLSEERFDLTSLIVNPSFETGDLSGWDSFKHYDSGVRETANAIYTMSSSHGNYLFNTYIDSKTAEYNYFLLQTIKYLPAGLFELTAQLASSESSSTLSLVAGDKSIKVECSNEAVSETGSLLFRLNDNTDVRIGVTSNRWFKADDFHLYYMKDSYILRKPIESRIDKYEEVVQQATDRTDYDNTISDVVRYFPNLKTETARDSLLNVVHSAFIELLENVPSKCGQYDITSLVNNPNFIDGRIGWALNGEATFSNNIGEVFNNTATFSIKQTMQNMPAGWYTVTAKAFSRTTDFASALSTYLSASPRVKASISLDGRTEKIYNILDDSRFATTSTGFEYYGKPDGTSVPNTMNKADQIFGFGHYDNILRVEKTKSGSLEFGLTLTNALTNNWLAFDDFHVYYGKTKEVLLDTLVTQNKTYANIRSERVLRKGILEAICLPYVPDINSFDSVYELASADNDKVVLLPVNEMKAGYVYFVKVANDTPLGADDVEITSILPDSIPALWNGTFQKGVYAKSVASNVYILNNEGTAFQYVSNKEVPAATPRFYLPSSLNVVNTTIPIEIHDDWMDMSFEPHIENFRVEEFIANNKYDRNSASVVVKYNQAPTWRRDQPRSVTIPFPQLSATPRKLSVELSTNSDMSDSIAFRASKESKRWYIYNLVPNKQYFYQVVADGTVITKGTFTPVGKVRMLRYNTGSNMRDIGGWTTTDGRTVKYGKIYRGGELHAGLETTLNKEDLSDFINLGIGAELDLRNNDQVINNTSPGVSALGEQVPYIYLNQYMFADDALRLDTMIYRKAFNFIADNLKENRVVYFHCIWGADRTGALAMLINGLLGVDLDQLYKDYELTSFSKAGTREKVGLDSKLDYLSEYGGTLQQQIYKYLNQYVNVPSDKLDFIIKEMLEGEPNSIQEYNADNVVNSDSTIYDLQGRRVNHPLKKGIYITNGKKFIIR